MASRWTVTHRAGDKAFGPARWRGVASSRTEEELEGLEKVADKANFNVVLSDSGLSERVLSWSEDVPVVRGGTMSEPYRPSGCYLNAYLNSVGHPPPSMSTGGYSSRGF